MNQPLDTTTAQSSFSSAQDVAPTLRRSSLASTGTITSSVSSNVVLPSNTTTSMSGTDASTNSFINSNNSGTNSKVMTSDEEQDDRRRSIKAIMKDGTLSQKDKSRKIQALMDGRGQLSQLNGGSAHNNNNNGSSSHNYRRGSMSSYCSNASSIYASSMAQVAADAACETSIYYDTNYTDYDVSLHTSRSYSYSGSYHDDSNETDHDHNSPPTATTLDPQQQQQQQLGSYRQYHGRSKSLQDWTDSDRANAAAHTTVFGDRIQHISRLMEQSRPACEHYERNCTIVSPCCGLAFGCRICHDDCPVLPPPIVYQRRSSANAAVVSAIPVGGGGTAVVVTDQCSLPARNNDIATTATTTTNNNNTPMTYRLNKFERRRSLPVEFTTERRPEDNHHLIDRFATREVICRHCYTRQSSKTYVSMILYFFVGCRHITTSLESHFSHISILSNTCFATSRNKCTSCSIQFGQYHCSICNLWMSDVESPYHCAECGFCRVGGRDNFRHCSDCGMCIDTLLFDDHNCKSGKYMSDCPICQEDLFSSRLASHEMPCGHAIHWHCFTELTTYDTRCPVCKKTVKSPDQMEATWNSIAMGIALQPVPPEMARMVNILCNDCEGSSYNQRWHFLGVRCPNCYSFNTIVEQLVLQGEAAAAYLDRVDLHHAYAEHLGDVPTDISLPTRYVDSQIDQYAMDNDDDSDGTMSDDGDMEE
jgi:RING finger and CHY zinc finger domain-containing protein 1